MAIEGPSGSGFDDQFWQTDAVNPGIFWESPHPLSIVGVRRMSEIIAAPPASSITAMPDLPDVVAEVLPLRASAPLQLHAHSGGFLVKAGRVDLFAVAL